jgi:hypothetical protein
MLASVRIRRLLGNSIQLISRLDVPYIANWLYEHPGLDLNLKGIWIADPSLSYDVVQQDIPSLRFVQVSCSSTSFKATFTRPLNRQIRICSPSTAVSWRIFRTSQILVASRRTWMTLLRILQRDNCPSLSEPEGHSTPFHRVEFTAKSNELFNCV